MQVVTNVSEARAPVGPEDAGTIDATVDGLVVEALLLASGADTSLVAKGVNDALEADEVLVSLRRVADQKLTPVGDGKLIVSRIAQFRKVMVVTSADPLMLRNLECLVDETDSSHDLIVSRLIMKILGYSTDELLVRAHGAQTEWELTGADDTTIRTDKPTPLSRLQTAAIDIPVANADVGDYVERQETRTAFPKMAPGVLADLIRTLEMRFKIATDMVLVLEPRDRLKSILRVRQNVFRL